MNQHSLANMGSQEAAPSRRAEGQRRAAGRATRGGSNGVELKLVVRHGDITVTPVAEVLCRSAFLHNVRTGSAAPEDGRAVRRQDLARLDGAGVRLDVDRERDRAELRVVAVDADDLVPGAVRRVE